MCKRVPWRFFASDRGWVSIHWSTVFLILAWLPCTVAVGVGFPVAGEFKKVDFDREIRPILSNKCFQCHGPDANQRKAKLRLDTPEGAFGETESGNHPIVAGKLDESELFQRIIAQDKKVIMPPPKSEKPLEAAEIEKLRAWIEQGADYKRHWAFMAPIKPSVPSVKDPAWCAGPIDFFVLKKLEKGDLKPSVRADKITLLRRLSLDLTGLPPSIEDVNTFLDDKSENAYERQVDRLLSSPHYGERWARLWLDAARYADSDGYEKDKPRFVWAYRDWVIGALNRDLPYNQFVIEQIAGDLLPGASQDQIVATGFLRNSMINEEGGIDPEQFRMEAMFDRMDAIGKSVLGLTIQCAQCHTHKYDPITHEDYYRMFAFLNNAHEANVAVYSPEDQKRRTEVYARVRAAEADLERANPDSSERLARWEERIKADEPAWTLVRPEVDDLSNGGQKYVSFDDGSILAQGYAPTKHRVKMTVKVDLAKINTFRLEFLNDPTLPFGGPGRSIKGTGALTEFEVEAAPASDPSKVEKIKIKKAFADLELPETPLDSIYEDKSKKRRVTGPIAFAFDGKEETAWGFDAGPGLRNQPREAIFVTDKPIEFAGGAIVTIYLKQNHGGWNSDDNQNQNLGRFRISVAATDAEQVTPLPINIREALALPVEQRSVAQFETLFRFWRPTVKEWKDANEKIDAIWREHPEGSTQLALQERTQPRPTHRLDRGDFLKPKERVEPGVPGFLHPLPADASSPKNRLTFARWLVDRGSPTSARSIVNRTWQAHFGTGLVSTSEDLGSQCETPSHPELLDWLAVEFMDQGWSLKTLHKMIAMSSAYQQSSRTTPELAALDPANRLLARGPRLRVEAEQVRDIALAASGLLNRKIGGPSVFPPAPEFLFQPPASYGPKVWKESLGPDRYRRALYTFRFRSVPYPMLEAFDAPNGDFSCVRRARSNTPLQALTVLNEPLFLESARALALETITSGGSEDNHRITYAFRRCVAREPTLDEQKTLLGLLERQTKRFADPSAHPWSLAANDPKAPPKLPEGTTPAQLAAWTVVSRVLLNLDETITRE